MTYAIDLNADLGEGCGNDDDLLDVVTSANIACGGHAGDIATMERTVRAALARGVAIGAHPSYIDPEHFGRRDLQRSPDDVYRDVTAQIRALHDVASRCGATLSHVKAHGALYNRAARDAFIADAISQAVRDFDASLALVGLARGAQIASAQRYGLRAVREVFADRAYDADGFLVPRSRAGATIEEVSQAVEQALRFARNGEGDSICLHGDGPQALEFARAIRDALAREKIRVRSFARDEGYGKIAGSLNESKPSS